MTSERIVMIGAGNVAHHLAPALLKAGLNLCQIYSRTIESARALGMKTGISYTSDIAAVYPDADVYIFCVSDDVLLPLLKCIRIKKNALTIHTSGSVPMDVFQGIASRYGVLYPLQTFSKERSFDFSEVPLCIEASDGKTLKAVRELAECLSQVVREVSSEKRRKLHLAGVFANNFTNHLYYLAGRMVEEEGFDIDLLRPLIFETAHKAMLIPPVDAQTGPAVRGDEKTLAAHRAMLDKDSTRAILYDLFTKSIQRLYEKKEEVAEKEVKAPVMLSLW